MTKLIRLTNFNTDFYNTGLHVLSQQAEIDALKSTIEGMQSKIDNLTNDLRAKNTQLSEVLRRGTPGLDGLVQTLYDQIDTLQKALDRKDAMLEDKEAQIKKANEVIQNIVLTKCASRTHTETTIDKGKRKRPNNDGSKMM